MLIYSFSFDNRSAHVLAESESSARLALDKLTANYERAELTGIDEPMIPMVLYCDLLPF